MKRKKPVQGYEIKIWAAETNWWYKVRYVYSDGQTMHIAQGWTSNEEAARNKAKEDIQKDKDFHASVNREIAAKWESV